MPPASRMLLSRGENSARSVTSSSRPPQWDLLVTVLQAFAHVRKFPLVALLELLVVRLVCELQGKNALGDQIPPVDAGEALSYHRSDAEVQRGQGRVLAATTLTVVVPAHDKARRHLFGLLVVLGVEAAEGETGDLGHVRAEGHYLHPIWCEVSSRDVVPDDDGHGALERAWQFRGLRWRLDVGAARHLDAASLLLRRGV